jgi:spore maturation protein CgeB
MKIVIFGLSISSSWGNGHATLWRGLCNALIKRGHTIVFFERDVPWYAGIHRDLTNIAGGELVLYPDWATVLPEATRHLDDADVALVTSYCPDGIAASQLVLASSAPVRAFYDLDTPITLSKLEAGEQVAYIDPERGLADFDIVLSYTGGEALNELQNRLGARLVAPLYGSVDPTVHKPSAPVSEFRADLSYLGTYAEDRQEALHELFLETARRLPDRRFLIGGAQYPQNFPWINNIFFVRHIPPDMHSGFYCSSPVTLNVTRRAMAAMGYCPSGRLFEAAACGVAIASDSWAGLDQFYEPGQEILVCHNSDDVVEVLKMRPERLAHIALAARRRTLESHTAEHRAIEMESILDSVYRSRTLDDRQSAVAAEGH